MRNRYSLYDAKAHLSAIVRLVREGHTAVITHRGKPVAEIRPVKDVDGVEERLSMLEDRGIILPAANPAGGIPVLATRRGALKRFIAERD